MNRFKITFLIKVFGEGQMKRTYHVNAANVDEATRFAKAALTLLEGRTVEHGEVDVHEVTMEEAILEALTDYDDGVAR